jgi:hypothetical protein
MRDARLTTEEAEVSLDSVSGYTKITDTDEHGRAFTRRWNKERCRAGEPNSGPASR